jgi:hypothetical protein
MSNNFLSAAFGTAVPAARISPDQFLLMEECGGKLDYEARDEISRLVNKYLSKRHMQIVWPKANTKMKKSLQRIAEHSYTSAREISGDPVRDLIREIIKAHEKEPEVAARKTKGMLEAHDAVQYLLTKNLGIEIDKLDAHVTTLFHISHAARRALSELPSGKSGPVKDTEIVPFLRELHVLFTKAGGTGTCGKDPGMFRDPYKGKFFRFVTILLDALPEEYRRTNQALGKIFEQAAFQQP